MLQPPSLISPGTLIAGKYRTIRPIGEGAMGAVWAAVNEATGREVALKLIVRPEPEFRHRLQREALALGSLKHRNVIDIYDIGQTDDGDPFLVMQLLHGETVAELLARKRSLGPTTAVQIGRDVAKALAAAHAVPIIHRDLKPANIFLHQEPDEGMVVKVLDFGVAKNLAVNDGMHTTVGGAVGSPLYMSPEQVRAALDVDQRADIWSLGVVLFEMLTGHRPFDGDAHQVFGKILGGEIPMVDRYVRRIDPGLVQVVSRCMRRNRQERFQSAAEVASALEGYASAGAAVDGVMGSSPKWPQLGVPASQAGQPLRHEGGAWPHAQAEPQPPRPQASSTEMAAPQPGGAGGWTQGGTVKMTGEDMMALRNQVANLRATGPLSSNEGAMEAVGGAAPEPELPSPDFQKTLLLRGISSTTMPLVRGADASGAGTSGTMGAVLMNDRRRQMRVIAAVAGILLGVMIAGVTLMMLSGERGRGAADQASPPWPIPAPSAPPPVPPSAKAPEVPTLAPTDAPDRGAPNSEDTSERTPATPPVPGLPSSKPLLPSPTVPAKPGTGNKPDPCAGKKGFLLTECKKKHAAHKL